MTFRQKTMAKLGKEPATPGYTGYIPAMRNHLIGHSYGDSTRRAAACTDSLRHKEYPKAIDLTVETRPNERNFFYAQTSRAALEQPPKAIKWIASKRDLPPDMWATSGLMDIRRMKTCIGTTPTAVTSCAPHMSIPDMPYKDRTIPTRRTFEELKDDVLEVAEGRHHVKGYSGHTHAKQHIYGKSYGKVTRILRPLPADPRTSREFQDYADSRALVVNEFELKQAGMQPKMRYHHFTLLAPGHKPGGCLGMEDTPWSWASTLIVLRLIIHCDPPPGSTCTFCNFKNIISSLSTGGPGTFTEDPARMERNVNDYTHNQSNCNEQCGSLSNTCEQMDPDVLMSTRGLGETSMSKCRCCSNCTCPGPSPQHAHQVHASNSNLYSSPQRNPNEYQQPPSNNIPTPAPAGQGVDPVGAYAPGKAPGPKPQGQGQGAPGGSQVREDIEWKWPDPVGFQAQTPPRKFLKPHW